jgi:hypothetical protein
MLATYVMDLYLLNYSLIEPASHCTPQIHMPLNNCYSWTNLRTSADFGQLLYTAPDSIRMEIAPNMVSAPHVASSAFHSASLDYSRVEEGSANTPTPAIIRSDFDKGSNMELTIEDLPVEYEWEAFMAHYDVTNKGLVLWDTKPFFFDISKVIHNVKITTEQTNSSNDVQSSDCISALPRKGSASILGSYPTSDSKVTLPNSYDMHNSKTSATDDHQEDLASNGIKEETNYPASNIDRAKQQASSSVSANKIVGHVFDDVKETDVALEKSIFTISNKPSRCVDKWVDAESALFVCSALNPVAQTNRQNKKRYTFDISNCDEIFDILVLEKKIRIHVDHVISSSKELGKCA